MVTFYKIIVHENWEIDIGTICVCNYDILVHMYTCDGGESGATW